MRGGGRRRFGLLAGLITASLLTTGQAGAATQVGETVNPDTVSCGPTIALQTGSPGDAYRVPFPGIITSWSYQASSDPSPQLKFKVGRNAGGNNYTIVGESEPATPVANQLNTFPTRIAVQTNDVIGMFYAPGGECGRSPAPGYSDHSDVVDHPLGSTMTYFPNSGTQWDVSASLEADADGDGFGDETQDFCPTDPLTQAECPAAPDTAPPDTSITKRPKDKSKSKQATFEFSGTDARAVAGFECSLDGAAFAPCTSPRTLKVKRGKHTFSVRATDAAGNVDATPATDGWKVKKRKKK